MSKIVFFNGKFVNSKKAKIDIEDRGFQFADGVYEVFNVSESKLVEKIILSTDSEKYFKFKKFKENVKNILNTNKNVFITIYPYKYDTIEKQEAFGEWRGVKYIGYWDMFVKSAF